MDLKTKGRDLKIYSDIEKTHVFKKDQVYDWMTKGECFSSSDPIFFLETYEMPQLEILEYETYVAEIYCNKCPVQEQCLNFAENSTRVEGIWGGQYFHSHTTMNKRLKAKREKFRYQRRNKTKK